MEEKKPTFYMMVGVPGSGKTTYARQIPNTTVLSSDDIRAEIGADGGDKKMHKQVFDILNERTKEALSVGNDVVYDATNLRHARRGRCSGTAPVPTGLQNKRKPCGQPDS